MFRRRITCKSCAYFSRRLCWYVASDGKKNKSGNTIEINFNMVHNCPDYRHKNYAGGGIDWMSVDPEFRQIPLLLPEVVDD